jgi:hypothetical protein
MAQSPGLPMVYIFLLNKTKEILGLVHIVRRKSLILFWYLHHFEPHLDKYLELLERKKYIPSEAWIQGE